MTGEKVWAVVRWSSMVEAECVGAYRSYNQALDAILAVELKRTNDEPVKELIKGDEHTIIFPAGFQYVVSPVPFEGSIKSLLSYATPFRAVQE